MTGADQLQIDTAGGAVVFDSVYTEGGHFIGRDQINNFLISIYSQEEPEAAERYRRFSSEQLQPYRPDRPFTVEEALLFTGREEHVQNIVNQARDPHVQAVAVYGPPDVGKTSLLIAGITPGLAAGAALVIHLSDHSHPVPLARAALLGRARQQKLDLPLDTPLPELMQTLTQTTGRGVTLLLDQFERFFQPGVSEIERAALRRDFERILALVEPRFFNVIFAMRDDLQAELDRLFGELLPGLRQSPVHLEPLTREQAKQAILHPLSVVRLATFERNVVEDALLPDLVAASGRQNERVLPADLQIVCDRLYQAVQAQPSSLIDEALYLQASDGKGAERLLDQHFDRLLGRVPLERQPLAREIANNMLDPSLHFWVTPEDLAPGRAERSQVEATLQAMAEAGLLAWHWNTEQRCKAYAFASHSIANAAYRSADKEARRRYQAHNELSYVWRAWVAYDAWASRGQLRYLETYSTAQTIPPERALLLLRSAIRRRLPLDPWLARSKQANVGRLARQLEESPSAGATPEVRLTRLSQARLLLGIADEKLPHKPDGAGFGPVAWSAAAHPDPDARQASTLALLSAYGEAATPRLEAAVQAGELGNGRLNSLRAILSDASPEIEKMFHTLPASTRIGIWSRRVGRRLVADVTYIGGLAFGGALGAGLGLGLLRALLANLIDEGSGFYFYSYAPSGFLLGLGLALGLLLANVLRLQPSEHSPGEAARRSPVLAVALGTLGFALAHLFLVLTLHARAIVTAWLIPVLAPLAGLGLSLAIYDQPLTGWRLGARRWLARLAAAAAGCALTQWLLMVTRDYGDALVIGWSDSYLAPRLRDNLARWGLEAIASANSWSQYAAIIDAALTGIALALGLTAGLVFANRLYHQWEELVRRAGD